MPATCLARQSASLYRSFGEHREYGHQTSPASHGADESLGSTGRRQSTQQPNGNHQVPTPDSRSSQGGVTARALLLGAALIPANCWWIVYNEVRWNLLQGTSLQLFVTPIMFLFALTGINALLRRRAPRIAFQAGELLTVYVMLVISCAVAGRDMIANLIPVLGYGRWFATPENQWADRIFPLLPQWLLVWDRSALEGYWTGASSIYRLQNLLPWLLPTAAWSLFLTVLLGTMLCLGSLVRRPWVYHERLSFPLTQLPLAMVGVGQETPFYRSRLMWLGFGLTAAMGTLNSLHALFPAVPSWPMEIDLTPSVPLGPWRAMGRFSVSYFPFAIGMAFFLPLNLSFSCWVLFFLTKLEMVATGLVGSSYSPWAAHLPEQAVGGWLALGFLSLWGTRRHLKLVLASLGSARRAADGIAAEDAHEPLSYRMAVAGFGVGLLLLIAFWRFAGMTLGFALLFFGVYLLLSVAFTRVRAEVGPPSDLWMSPDVALVGCLGTAAIGQRNLALLGLLFWINSAYRNHPMMHEFEAFQFAERGAMSQRRMLGAVCVAILLAILCAFWTNLDECYRDGAAAKCVGIKSWVAESAYLRISDWLSTVSEPDRGSLVALLAGAGAVSLLRALGSRFLWWSLHPAGYALAAAGATNSFWLPLFLGWLAKLLLIRYGGLRSYRAAIPFFLGLILGDYVTYSAWAGIRGLLGAGQVTVWWVA